MPNDSRFCWAALPTSLSSQCQCYTTAPKVGVPRLSIAEAQLSSSFCIQTAGERSDSEARVRELEHKSRKVPEIDRLIVNRVRAMWDPSAPVNDNKSGHPTVAGSLLSTFEQSLGSSLEPADGKPTSKRQTTQLHSFTLSLVFSSSRLLRAITYRVREAPLPLTYSSRPPASKSASSPLAVRLKSLGAFRKLLPLWRNNAPPDILLLRPVAMSTKYHATKHARVITRLTVRVLAVLIHDVLSLADII
ncbi:hypothetical protein BDW71DRAFT_10766 [Aspergillus fruticulosus]